ncbi:hypothetical protein [Aquimarina spongiae]|uniref:Uncharacterized protein n=1 Tax=Aquimarina spongiae TaxID=570521 RepID=A0A1M6E5U3_9FLAO|nr:hypothetical protein [Aquimarina spongiae]SHI80876.1 hypothetical protein SAMN04488508_103236 [Aquimarina spongiae]
MFKLLVSFIFLLTLQSTIAQKTNDAVFFSQTKQINRFYTISELEALKKGELIHLYKQRVEEIMIILPFLSLTNEAGVRLSDIGIKEDSRNVKVLKNNTEAVAKSLESTKVAIEELVPYADTEKIIWTILYLEEIIKKMRIGVNGNF